MIRIVILGTSASVPSVSRNLSSVGLRYEGEVYLFDCGEGTQRQMMKYRLSYAKTRAIFITHLHADHYLGLAGLCHTLKMIDRGKDETLFIYGPRGMTRCVEGLGCNYEFLKVKDVGEGLVHKGDGFSVRAFPVVHGRNALGFVFEEDEGRNFIKAKCDGLGIKGVMFRELERKGEIIVGGKKVKLEEVTRPKKGKKMV
ncbi:MAG: MBL fold metallo-hydrolase, partial [Candidatus Aenigmarchaeota archaeon]|nr:MBL fold metallo-hydrolase [Candidatus Aenigmarchaeota archaeon]